MLVGSINNPHLPLEDELRRIAKERFDFADVTLEPPGAWPRRGEEIGRLLAELGLAAVGHTAYYLPIASPFPELRERSRNLLQAAFETFAAAGIALVNVHPDGMTRMFSQEEIRERNAEAIARLAEDADERGCRLMVENLGTSFSRVDDLAVIFSASDKVGFHLDVGHAHLHRDQGEPNRTRTLLEAFADRLAHVHVHDNLGEQDLHLPLGAGTIDWRDVACALSCAGWDGTVTLEVFAPERAHLDTSRRLWREWWRVAQTAAERESKKGR
ncbi:MAG: sugar phosphate isomerase/epimerase [Actinomycetota bacterium]|nr:sugar phosphate isomerase/epimerase [Actinomycetota bacterium]